MEKKKKVNADSRCCRRDVRLEADSTGTHTYFLLHKLAHEGLPSREKLSR